MDTTGRARRHSRRKATPSSRSTTSVAHCALWAFQYFSRPNRDPRRWTSAQLAKGYGDPNFVITNKIGFATHEPAPLRKLSWWFNGSLLQFGLLEQAGLGVEALQPGAIQPATCP